MLIQISQRIIINTDHIITIRPMKLTGLFTIRMTGGWGVEVSGEQLASIQDCVKCPPGIRPMHRHMYTENNQ